MSMSAGTSGLQVRTQKTYRNRSQETYPTGRTGNRYESQSKVGNNESSTESIAGIMNFSNEIRDNTNRINSIICRYSDGNIVFPLIIVLFLMLNILFIGHKVRFVQLGENLDSLQRELLIVRNRNAAINFEIASLAELPRIEQIATDSCNMQIADDSRRTFIVWDDTKDKQQSPETTAKKVWCKIKTQTDRIILPNDELVQEFRKIVRKQ